MFMHESDALLDIPFIRHGFFGRRGGVSQGIYSSLNTAYSSADDIANVEENRRRIAEQLKLRALVNIAQVHGNDVLKVTDVWPRDQLPEGDGMLTVKTGLGLGILTADCAPVLIADRKVPVIGAAHAGWGGAFKGVVENLIEKMLYTGGHESDLIVVIGPCIHQYSYEVGPEFYQKFVEADLENQKYFIESKREGHVLFDLPLYIEDRIKREFPKIAHISIAPQDTYHDETDFFSYRRATHQNAPDYGRQIAVIALAED